MVSHCQGLKWQHQNLLWGWRAGSSIDHRAREVDLIGTYRPLLNRHGRGYRNQLPTQLQRVGAFERERAWWLFHVAWLAVLTLRPEDWIQPWSRRRPWSVTDRVACDEDGWPLPLCDGENHPITIPDEWSARQMLVDAAPRELRNVVTDAISSADEATAW